MANNKIQVKRTNVAGRTANVSNAGNTQYIDAGEFALNMADQILYTSNGSTLITVGANLVNQRISNSVSIDNNKNIRFQTVNTAAYVGMRQQNDDNFVFYSTNTAYGERAIWSVFANSTTSAFSVSSPTIFNANVNLGQVALTVNNSTGSAGQVLTTNGSSTYWSTVSGSGTVNVNAQYVWTNTQTFQANISFTGNNISFVTNTGSILFAGSADQNWKIGRNTGSPTKFFYTNNTLDIVAAGSNLEGFVIGQPGANTYLETGYAGTFTRLPVYVGNSTQNVTTTNTAINLQSNTTVNATVNSSTLQVSNSTATSNLTAQGLSAGANVVANTTAFRVGNTTLTTTNAVFGGTIAANGGIGSAGQVLTSGAAGNAYWTTPTTGTVTSVASGNGITGGTITSTGTLYAVGGVGTVVNTGGVNVLANNGIVANSTGTFVNAQTPLVANATGLHIATSAGSGTYSSGISSITVDSVGRVTSVTGSAGYVTSSGVTSVASANGIAGGTITGTGTLYAVAGNSTVFVNATGIHVNTSSLAFGTGTVTSVASGNGITGGTIIATGTLTAVAGAGVVVNTSGINVLANNGITANSTGTFVTQGTGVAVNSTGVHVLANTGIVANTTGTFVNAAYIGTISANNASFLGTVAAASYVQNTDSRTLSGNLVISGTSFTPSSNTILLGNSTQRWVLSANTGSFSGAVSGITTLGAGNTTITGTLGAGNTTITGFANVTTTIQGGSSLTIAGALSGVTTAAMGNTTITGFANVTTTGQFGGNVAIAGIATLSANVVLGTTTITANGGVGTAGQVLTSGATGNVYWAPAAGGGSTNVNATYAWTNTHSFSNTITFSGNVVMTGSATLDGGPVTYSGLLGMMRTGSFVF